MLLIRRSLAHLHSPEERNVDPEDITQEHLSSYISEANAAISPFNFEIRSSLRQTPIQPNQEVQNAPPERVYALVNVHVDNLTQLATTYTADEIAFVKRVLDFMFDTNNTRFCEGMVISPIQAVQLAKVSSADSNRRRSTLADSQQPQGGPAQSLSMTQAENMMKNLVAEGWLEKSRKGNFSLTPRALMELKGWLRETYNYVNAEGSQVHKIKDCAACRDIITVVRVHFPSWCLGAQRSDTICRDNAVVTVIVSDGFTTTAFATSFVCSRLNNVQCARRTGRGISSSGNGPSSRRIEGSPVTLRGGVRLPRLRPMVLKALK